MPTQVENSITDQSRYVDSLEAESAASTDVGDFSIRDAESCCTDRSHTGEWQDGTSFAVNLYDYEEGNETYSHIVMHTPDTVPEPSTLALLAMGTFGLLVYGWRRRRTA